MPATRSQARLYTDKVQTMGRAVSNPFTALLQQLLEIIVVSCTSIEDKKALRQTCRVFQQSLDINMTCINLTAIEGVSRVRLSQLLKLMHMLKAATLNIYHFGKHSTRKVIALLPTHLATLAMKFSDINLKELRRLPCLTSLSLHCASVCRITGIGHVSGLKCFRTNVYVGSVAHLAPTLKHPSLREYKDVEDMNQSTNLQVLQIWRHVPANFFQTHTQLALEALIISPSRCSDFFESAQAWKSAPLTLTRLTLDVQYCGAWPAVLPASITHLQLVGASCYSLRKAAAALPGVRNLDLSIRSLDTSSCNTVLGGLSTYTNLQSLGFVGEGLQCQQILDEHPEVARALQMNVQLTVMSTENELLGVSADPFAVLVPAWAKLK